MRRWIFSAVLVLFAATATRAQEPESEEPSSTAETAEAASEQPSKEGPRTMSGMSILGNEEAPKSLVIVPWKSSEMGDELSLADTLDDRAQPVDKEVFQRQLDFYEIRSGK